MLCGGILSRHFVGHFAAACEKLDDRSQRGEWGQESGVWVVIKGHSNEIFVLKLSSSIKPTWVTDQQIKLFSILVQNSPSYFNFSKSSRGLILIFELKIQNNWGKS